MPRCQEAEQTDRSDRLKCRRCRFCRSRSGDADSARRNGGARAGGRGAGEAEQALDRAREIRWSEELRGVRPGEFARGGAIAAGQKGVDRSLHSARDVANRSGEELE
jgi:hypothetical protein